MRFKRSRVRQIRNKTSVKKFNKVNETPIKLSTSRKSPSVIKCAVNQKSRVFNQEKEVSYPESSIVKIKALTKGPWGLRNLGNTCHMNAIF